MSYLKMTELEYRAFMGNKKAQEECTEKGIVLNCPFCGKKLEIIADEYFAHPISGRDEGYNCANMTFCFKTDDKEMLALWNTRTAPPVGKCGECKQFIKKDLWCDINGMYMEADAYCCMFEPKGGEENEAQSRKS